jgi:hypothetical protein
VSNGRVACRQPAQARALRGVRHVQHSEIQGWHRDWLDTSTLPAERTDQNERLVERWIKAVGKFPD